MKVKGPKGWSGNHIISVKLLGWMNQGFLIKHLEGLELVWKLVHIQHCSLHTSSLFGHEMKMLRHPSLLSIKEELHYEALMCNHEL